MFRKQGGFTMIELIVVIAIIGILAAIAIPRFINQTTNARIAALNGLAGALYSSVALAETEYVGEGNTSASTATQITMNGQTVTVLAGTGAPSASAASGAVGIGLALQTISGFIPTYAGASPGIATYNFTTTVTNCYLTYTDSTAAVLLTTTGC